MLEHFSSFVIVVCKLVVLPDPGYHVKQLLIFSFCVFARLVNHKTPYKFVPVERPLKRVNRRDVG